MRFRFVRYQHPPNIIPPMFVVPQWSRMPTLRTQLFPKAQAQAIVRWTLFHAYTLPPSAETSRALFSEGEVVFWHKRGSERGLSWTVKGCLPWEYHELGHLSSQDPYTFYKSPLSQKQAEQQPQPRNLHRLSTFMGLDAFKSLPSQTHQLKANLYESNSLQSPA